MKKGQRRIEGTVLSKDPVMYASLNPASSQPEEWMFKINNHYSHWSPQWREHVVYHSTPRVHRDLEVGNTAEVIVDEYGQLVSIRMRD